MGPRWSVVGVNWILLSFCRLEMVSLDGSKVVLVVILRQDVNGNMG